MPPKLKTLIISPSEKWARQQVMDVHLKTAFLVHPSLKRAYLAISNPGYEPTYKAWINTVAQPELVDASEARSDFAKEPFLYGKHLLYQYGVVLVLGIIISPTHPAFHIVLIQHVFVWRSFCVTRVCTGNQETSPSPLTRMQAIINQRLCLDPAARASP
ncbi:hypothetical protein BDZ97DRAFT_119474 [Flammula alnicola]|nr:hypothetical protein BDZ97DRAFT_119474 [Flammula alnicola]